MDLTNRLHNLNWQTLYLNDFHGLYIAVTLGLCKAIIESVDVHMQVYNTLHKDTKFKPWHGCMVVLINTVHLSARWSKHGL